MARRPIPALPSSTDPELLAELEDGGEPPEAPAGPPATLPVAGQPPLPATDQALAALQAAQQAIQVAVEALAGATVAPPTEGGPGFGVV